MSERTSFSYDPSRQGYDTNSWRTVSGTPTIGAGGRLLVDSGADAGVIIHYADFLKGDISFNLNVPEAAAGGRYVGVSSADGSAYIRFSFGGTLTCETSNEGTSTVSSEILWNSDWTGNDIEFQIIWESGFAKFLINETQVYSVSDESVPYGPLSLYLSDNSVNAMTVGTIYVRGTQSFVMNPKTSDTSSFSGLMFISQLVTVTEGITMKIVNLIIPQVAGEMSDSVTVSENVSMSYTMHPSVSDTVTITESVSLTIV